ncbi:hypothetical protein [Paenibacillus chitinolyticus]|uniref:hypothetical protein n=1 Tax=Paenibacillus chitinolyticus TaxID=79263 RepID=UPI003D04117C
MAMLESSAESCACYCLSSDVYGTIFPRSRITISTADGVGGDPLTISQLLGRCVSEEQLYKAMPEVKEQDDAFRTSSPTLGRNRVPVVFFQELFYTSCKTWGRRG